MSGHRPNSRPNHQVIHLGTAHHPTMWGPPTHGGGRRCDNQYSSLPTISRRDNTKVLALASVPAGRAASHKGNARNGWIRPTRTKPAVGRQHPRACVNYEYGGCRPLYSSLRDAVRPLRCPAITLRSWLATSVAYLRQAVPRCYGSSSYCVGATYLRRRSLRSLCRRLYNVGLSAQFSHGCSQQIGLPPYPPPYRTFGA